MSGELIQNNGTSEGMAVEAREDGIMPLCPETASTAREGMKYGKVEHITYYSNTTGCDRGANILFPEGYSTEKKYPVLYFLHGIFGDENSMIGEKENKIDVIAGNLKADGLAKDVIVVFPNMFATGDPQMQPGFSAEQVIPYDNFINDLCDDLVPYIEANYPVLNDRLNRSVIGFSMGGRETLFIGTKRSDMFARFGGIAPAPGLVPTQDAFMSHVGQMSEEEMTIAHKEAMPELMMVCCGTQDGVVRDYPKSYHEIYSKNGVEHIWFEVPGADHNSDAIRSGFYNFMVKWFE